MKNPWRGFRFLAVVGPLGATALVCAACSRDPHAAALKYAKSGDEYASSGKTAEAIIEYLNALEKEPRAGDIRLKLADIYLKQGDTAKATQEYIRAADVLPDTAVQLKAGNLLLMARRFDDAKVRAERALANEPKNVDAQVLRANALAGLKNLDGAVAELEEAIQLNPNRSSTYANLGQLELHRGNRRAAEQAFQRAVELAPASAMSHLSLGGFYWSASQLSEAEAELKTASSVEPENVLALRTLSAFYLATNRRDQAEPYLLKVYEITRSATAVMMLADYYLLQKEESKARNLLEPLTRDPQATSAASVRLALMDRIAGQPKAATKRVDAILASNSKQLQALILKGTFLFEDGKFDEALTVARTAVDAHPDALAAHVLIGRVQAARHQNGAAIAAYQEAIRLNPLATGAKVALARLQLASGRSDSSAGLAQDVLKAEPQNADARLVLVQALIAQGELQRAQADLNALLAQFPDSAPVHVQAGMLHGRKREFSEARKEFERAQQLAPNSLQAIGGLIALDLTMKRPGDARVRVNALANASDPTAAGLMLAGRTYAGLGDLQASEQMFRRVLSKDSAHLAAYAALGQLYAQQRRLPEAITEFESLAQRDPNPVPALTLVAILMDAQGNRAGAQQRYERIIQLNPDAAVAANNLAWIYAEQGGNLDVALQLAQTAKRHLANTPQVNDTLGFIYYTKDLPSLAIPLLKAAVEQDPSNAEYRYHLGLAYRRAGDKVNAEESLSRALSLDRDFTGAEAARTALSSLQDDK